MPHLNIHYEARQGMRRCQRFLEVKSPTAARHAQDKIRAELRRLLQYPDSGRYWEKDKKYREIVIRFGKGSYLILYTFDKAKDEIRVVSFRHSRELAYKLPENFLGDEEE